jgi:hypothetical protein
LEPEKICLGIFFSPYALSGLFNRDEQSGETLSKEESWNVKNHKETMTVR